MLEFLKNIPAVIWGILFVAVLLAIYVTLSLKNIKKNQQRMLDLQANIKVGSEVILSSGIYGKVLSFDAVTMKLQIDDNVVIRVDRFAVSKIFSKEELKEQKKVDKKLDKKAEENSSILDLDVEEINKEEKKAE